MAASVSVQAILSNEGIGFEPTAFDGGSFATGANSDWVDLSGDLVELGSFLVAIRRGFQSAAMDDLVAAPSSLTFGLNNSVQNSGGMIGYYSPDAASGRAGWQSGIPIRAQVTANGTTRTRFYGWVDTIQPAEGLYGDQIVAVTATGWLAEAAFTPISDIPGQASQRDDQLLTTVIAQVTNQPPATSFDTGLEVYPYALDNLDPAQAMVLDAIDAVCLSGFSRTFEKADGTLKLETRARRQTVTADLLSLTDTAPGGSPGLAATAVAAQRRRDQIINRAKVTVHPRRIDAAPVVLYSVPASGSPVTVAGNGSTTVITGAYTDPNQQAQQIGGFNTLIAVAGVDTIGTSGTLPTSDYDFGSITAFCTVTVVYTARTVTFTIVNPGPAGSVTKLQCRGQGIYDYQPVTAEAINASSRTTNGQRTVTMDCPYNPVPGFARAAAQYALRVRAASLTMLDQGVQLFVHASDEVTMDTLLQREVSDPIAVSETVTGLNGNKFWINGIEETYDERANLTLLFRLVPRDTLASWNWGVSGVSEWGLTTYYGF